VRCSTSAEEPQHHETFIALNNWPNPPQNMSAAALDESMLPGRYPEVAAVLQLLMRD
jgi:hypothetical protein